MMACRPCSQCGGGASGSFSTGCSTLSSARKSPLRRGADGGPPRSCCDHRPPCPRCSSWAVAADCGNRASTALRSTAHLAPSRQRISSVRSVLPHSSPLAGPCARRVLRRASAPGGHADAEVCRAATGAEHAALRPPPYYKEEEEEAALEEEEDDGYAPRRSAASGYDDASSAATDWELELAIIPRLRPVIAAMRPALSHS